MTNKQYKNIVNMTKNEASATADSEAIVRKTLKNCGVALPSGNIPEIKKLLTPVITCGGRAAAGPKPQNMRQTAFPSSA